MTVARLRLDDQLCFALYAATNAITRAYRPLLRELGVTYPQYLTLMALWQHSTGTVSELAHRLDLPAHAMTPLPQRLEQATREGCRLVNCTGQSVRTLNLRPQRISVELDDAGLVVGAHRG